MATNLTRRTGTASLLATIAVLTVAGCGGAAKDIDKSGFSAKNRTSAQAALNKLKGTNIPGTVVQLTATVGLPAVCRVRFEKQNPKDLDLFMAWVPIPKSGDAFTYFSGSIGPYGAIPQSLHLGTTTSQRALEAHYPAGFNTNPFEPCRIDAYGNISVVPWTGAYPSSGKARAKYDD